MDRLTLADRSKPMSKVRGKNTRPEIAVRRTDHAMELRFRLHRSDLPGKPDLVFPRFKAALFVHGCFWHRHQGCAKSSTPKSNTSFWESKFNRNVERDERDRRKLEAVGWRVGTVWECETRNEETTRNRLRNTLKLAEVNHGDR